MKKFIYFFATWGYLGRSPKAPGTVGTIGTLPLAYLFYQFNDYGYVIATFVFTLFSLFICIAYENVFQTHDPQEVVIDEVAGFLIAMTLLPFTWQAILLAFVLFRVLDILKPFPIGWADKKIKGGLGVLADDIFAGVFSNVILQIVYVKTSWLGAQLVQ
ncbi:MAG: phosphatidylglycerophosphatase A [Bdellovibrionales bacterium]|nr:phosphatidylglycerophosphatase A [Bdellovibrionales bacterium]